MKDRPMQTLDGLTALASLRSKLDTASSLEVIHEDGYISQAYFTFNPPAKAEEIDELKRSLRVPLPKAYEQFLLQYNGALLYYDKKYGQWGFQLYGTREILEGNKVCWEKFGDEWPHAYLVFAKSRGDTDRLILDTAHFVNERDCRVIDGDGDDSPPRWTVAARSFGDWLDRLVVAQGAKYWRWY